MKVAGEQHTRCQHLDGGDTLVGASPTGASAVPNDTVPTSAIAGEYTSKEMARPGRAVTRRANTCPRANVTPEAGAAS